MIQDYLDLDDKKIRYVSESSNTSTSGYSTMSPNAHGNGFGELSPASATGYSPAHSPATILQNEFSNLNLPRTTGVMKPPQQQQTNHPLTANYTTPMTYTGSGFMDYNSNMNQYNQTHNFNVQPRDATNNYTQLGIKSEYTASLHILEQPVEKFRFRYKSEMHGTHGSLNGANSKRSPKTFPEVELRNFNGNAVIRCSLFQANIDSPHSHQLVIRKDDQDLCDPHDLNVSLDRGYVSQFQNMGIIHTAKKFIFDELLKKKSKRLKFVLGRETLTTKEQQELRAETEKESKEMNLNQVRLCFEAFKINSNNTWTSVAAPVFTNLVNNRKSAQTGELRICRLSIVTGSVNGGDDLILLVEKVSKKNIKVRFFEQDEDDETVWEAYAKFRESDVHHQYAIVCQTPPYKNKDIDKPIEVYIELVRPSDDERSGPPVQFRYKPRDAIASRKRRRTCSTATSSSDSLSSLEMPKTVQEQQMQQHQQQPRSLNPFASSVTAMVTNSGEWNKSLELKKLMDSAYFQEHINTNSDELAKICEPFHDYFDSELLNNLQFSGRIEQIEPAGGRLETDGHSTTPVQVHKSFDDLKNKTKMFKTFNKLQIYPYLNEIFKIYDNVRINKNINMEMRKESAKRIADIFIEYAETNELGDTLIHEIVINNEPKIGIKLFHIINFFELNYLLNRSLNLNNESGLHTAVLLDRSHFIRPLLGMGCNANIQDKCGNTALHVAIKEMHIKCAECFLNATDASTIDLTIKNDEGLTPLNLTLRIPNSELAEKLLNYNAKIAAIPNAKDGNNALHMVIIQQNIKLVELILSKENAYALLYKRNTAGLKPIDLAREINTIAGKEILKTLLKYAKEDEDKVIVAKIENSPKASTSTSSLSSSSTATEDDDEVTSIENVAIKQEILDDVETSNPSLIECKIEDKNLNKILDNLETRKKLSLMLENEELWKKLAKNLKMQHLICLWSNAEELLNFIKRKPTINFVIFLDAIKDVDKNAYDFLNTI